MISKYLHGIRGNDMKAYRFKGGDIVRYIGKRSPFLIGEIGTVVERPLRQTPGNVDIRWGDGSHYGCYHENLELLPPREPDWEV